MLNERHVNCTVDFLYGPLYVRPAEPRPERWMPGNHAFPRTAETGDVERMANCTDDLLEVDVSGSMRQMVIQHALLQRRK